MKKEWPIIALFFLLITGCVLIITTIEYPECNIVPLVLDEERMPGGWRRSGLGTAFLAVQDRQVTQQAYYIFMENGNGTESIPPHTAHHTVYQYSNSWLATFYVWFEKESFFSSSGWQWSKLEGIDSLPLHADQIQIKCGDGNGPYYGDRCAAALRYGPYISDFSSSIQEEVMSTEEFKEMVLEIDELFGACGE